uniref:Transmembrane protein 100 n=1 Tax=Eptatretus burgeri TaxID=7764 RepID=A0A8C4WSW2_EPTBU
MGCGSRETKNSPHHACWEGRRFVGVVSTPHEFLCLFNAIHQYFSAVGGAERSCYRCVLPFGLVAMLVGTVDSVVALTLGPPTSSAAVLGLLLLSLGVTLLLSGFICCQLQHWRKVRRLRASLIPLDDGGEAEEVKTGGHVV